MKRAAILMTVTVMVLAGCTAKKKADGVDKGGKGPAPMADKGGMRQAPAKSDATAEFDKILAKNKELAKIMGEIKTLDDLKKKKPEYVKLNVDILKLTIASLRKAVSLSPEQLRAYVTKYTAMNKANAEFGKKLVEMQQRVMKIEGAKKFITETQKSLAEKLKPLALEMRDLVTKYSAKMKAMMKKQPQPPAKK